MALITKDLFNSLSCVLIVIQKSSLPGLGDLIANNLASTLH